MNWNYKMGSFVALLCLVLNTGFSQINQYDSEGKRNGIWSKNFPDSQIKRYQGRFDHGEPVGKFVYYFPNGVVRSIVVHDSLSNRATGYFYFRSKALAAYGIYHGQKKDSVWTEFSPNGDITSKVNYKNGKKNGEKIIYYPADPDYPKVALVLKKIHFKNDLAEGDFVAYFDDGTIKAKGQYNKGQLDGKIIKYHPNGKIRLIERYRGGIRHGWWFTYDENGEEQGRNYYKDGSILSGKDLKKYMEELKAKGINPNE